MKDTVAAALTAAVAASLAFSPALAQTKAKADGESRVATSGHSKSEFVDTYDADGDGKVSKAEFEAARARHFKDLDLNKDGKVDEAEYVTEYSFRLDQELARRRAGQIRQAHFRFGVLDTEKNADLSSAEFAESGDRMFSRLDDNGDGIVDEKDTAKAF